MGESHGARFKRVVVVGGELLFSRFAIDKFLFPKIGPKGTSRVSFWYINNLVSLIMNVRGVIECTTLAKETKDNEM